MSDKKTWKGSHTMPCGITFPLKDEIDSLIIQIHQENCVVDNATYIAFLETLRESE